MTIAKFKVEALVFEPIAAASAPNNSLFSDSANANLFTNKSAGGSPDPIGASTSVLVKQMENQSGSTIASGRPVSKKANGTIVEGDSDAALAQQLIGITLQSIAHAALGNVALLGQNVPGAVTGLGFAPGQDIYLSETGGYTNDPNSFTGNNDSIIRIGIADCPAGAASGTATDLVLFPEVIARP